MASLSRRILLAALPGVVAGLAGCMSPFEDEEGWPPVGIHNGADGGATVDVTVRALPSEAVALDRTIDLPPDEGRGFRGFGTGDHRVRVEAFGHVGTEEFDVREGAYRQLSVEVDRDGIRFGTIVA